MKKAKENTNLRELLVRLKQSNFEVAKKQLLEETDEVTVKEQERRLPKTAKNISKDIQEATDEYLNTWLQMKELEKKTRELRKVIKPYMDNRNITYIEGTQDNGSIELANQDRVEITSRYTSYSVTDLQPHIPFDILQEAIVEVVDADRLNAVISLSDNIPNTLLEELKIKVPTTIFKVNRP